MTFIWTWIKKICVAIGNLILRYPLAAAASVFLIAVAIAAACLGNTLQIGGLLGWLWGKKPVDPSIRVTPPPGRVDANGVPIPVGQSDDHGYVQEVQLPIKDPGIFSNPDQVVVNHPNKGEVVIPLPTGVKNTDVNQVVQISENIYQIKNNDKSTVDTVSLLNDLGKP
jgi:hypothetical protein